MTDATTVSAYGERIAPATVRLERLLPGPIERVWSYLTDSDLRGQWLAVGQMGQPGSKVELVWRNDELVGEKEQRPDGTPEEHRMECEVVRAEPPHVLVLGWGGSGSEVRFDLALEGAEVKLTVTHSRLPSRDMMLGVSAGWHAHLDLLVARLRETELPKFWANWTRLRADYDARLPAGDA